MTIHFEPLWSAVSRTCGFLTSLMLMLVVSSSRLVAAAPAAPEAPEYSVKA